LLAVAVVAQVLLVLQRQESMAVQVEVLHLPIQRGQLQQVQESAAIMLAVAVAVVVNRAVFQVQEPLAVAGALLTVLLWTATLQMELIILVAVAVVVDFNTIRIIIQEVATADRAL
jgi:hypothetical protein